MKINVISVGKLSRDYKQLAIHYSKMIKWQLKETELTYPKKLPESQIKSYEAALICNHLNTNSYQIALDIPGKQLDSKELSLIFKKQMAEGKDIDIVIGGAYGLDNLIIKNDTTPSIGKNYPIRTNLQSSNYPGKSSVSQITIKTNSRQTYTRVLSRTLPT